MHPLCVSFSIFSQVKEPWMRENVIITLSTKPCDFLLVKTSSDEVLDVFRHADLVSFQIREADLGCAYQHFYPIFFWVGKGRESGNHLIDQNPKCPPISSLIIPQLRLEEILQCFRRLVVQQGPHTIMTQPTNYTSVRKVLQNNIP